MDLNNYWQENKRFLLTIAAGLLVFFIGWMLIGRFFGDELGRQRLAGDSAARKLRTDAMYTPSDLSDAQAENEALKASVDVLQKSTAFHARSQFVLDPKRGSPNTQYFAVVSQVREELLKLAGRNNLRLPEDLGLPALSPTRESDIARYLEALDLVDRGVRMALAAQCERIDKIDIKLDPRLTSREGVGNIERTRIVFVISGKPAPLVEFLALSQQPAAAEGSGGPLLIEKSDMLPARAGNEAALEVTFLAARLVLQEARVE